MEKERGMKSASGKGIINQQRCAAALIIVGVGFCLAMMLMALAAPVYTERDAAGHLTFGIGALAGISDGTVPALAVFLIIIGIIFYYPSLINSSQREMGVDTSQFSSMRLAVLMVVCCFVLINIKNGWSHGLTRDQLEPWWIILAVAIGSKALQYFAEVKKAGLQGSTELQSSALRRGAQGPTAPSDPSPSDTPIFDHQDASSDVPERHSQLNRQPEVQSSAHSNAIVSSTTIEQLGAGRTVHREGPSAELTRLLLQHDRALHNKHTIIS